MAEGKKYFWLKLKRDFFKRHDIQYIESLPNGKDLTLFYLKLLCESVDHEGNLRFSDDIPYTEDMLASITNTSPEVVRNAMKTFTDLKIMEVKSDGTIFLPKATEMMGFETEWARKQREYRDKQRQSEDNERTKKDNVFSLSDKSKRKSKSKSNKDIYGEAQNVLLSSEEYEKIKEKGLTELIDELSLYMASKQKTYADHYMTILAWGRRREKEKPVSKPNQFTEGVQKSNYDMSELEKKLIKN